MQIKPKFVPCGVIVGLVLSGTLLGAQKTSKTMSTIEVTASIADLGATGQPYLVRSDGKGAYVSVTSNKTKQVSSILIQGRYGTDWSLTTYYSERNSYRASDRTVHFDLGEQVAAGSFPTPFLGTENGIPVERGEVTAHLITKCSVVNIDMLALTTGTTVSCPGSLRFRSPAGEWYRLSFQPDNYPQSERFRVTCERADTTGCREWTIGPDSTRISGTDPNHKSRNTLLSIDEGGTILAQGGDYLLSFGFRVTR